MHFKTAYKSVTIQHATKLTQKNGFHLGNVINNEIQSLIAIMEENLKRNIPVTTNDKTSVKIRLISLIYQSYTINRHTCTVGLEVILCLHIFAIQKPCEILKNHVMKFI